MIRSLCAFLLGIVLTMPVFAATPLSNARGTVRLMQGVMTPGTCSAVVVAPGIALTAKHCIDMLPNPIVGGLQATITRVHPTSDLAELSVPGLACPCVQISADRAAPDETVYAIGWLYGDVLVTSRGDYLGPVVSPDGPRFGLAVMPVGPGMSGGGVYRVYVTGEIRLIGIVVGLTPQGGVAFFTEVSRDAKPWE